MKQTVRYQCLTIPNKIRVDIRLNVDETRSSEYISNIDGNKSDSVALYPIISISIIRQNIIDESGNRVRAPWNPNDSLTMTKFNFPIFVSELESLSKDLLIPELYTYTGKRLELNEEVAAKVRRVFMIGTMTIELSPVVISNDDSRIEGIKVKFNNEQSSFLLTLNELTALQYTLEHLDINVLALLMYNSFIEDKNIVKAGANLNAPVVDIQPKFDEFK
jgi:hypothetical protein